MHTVRISLLLIFWEIANSENVAASTENAAGIRLDRVEGLAIQCGFNLVAVGSRQLISIYSQDPSKDKHIGELVGSIPLPKSIADSGYIELQFLNESQLFYCDSNACNLCSSSSKDWSCIALVVGWNGEESSSLLSVSATSSSEKLFIRVAELTRAAVLTYPVEDVQSLHSVQSAPDAPYIRGFDTVSGFSRGSYKYFIGSAYQPFEPVINANLGAENRTITKITRICASDLTPQLESRIDLAIECGFGDKNKRVEASFYDVAHDQVIVAMTGDNRNWSICAFSMMDIEERFDKDWSLCQKTTLRDSALNCEAAASAEALDDHCHIFTRKADAFRMQTCSRFGQDVQRIYENCNLHQYRENSYRYGWLEDFRPVTGTLIASVTAGFEKIVTVLPDYENEALFIGGYAGLSMLLLRVSWQRDNLSSHSRIFWRRRSYPLSRFPMCLDGRGKTLFILNSTTVVGKRISCSGLYSTCDELAEGGWQDPLSCIWCPDEQRKAVTSSYDKLGCLHPITKTCPPVVDHANRNENHSEWEIFGSNLDRMQDVDVYVCDQRCKVNRLLSSSSKLLCVLSDGSVQDAACNVRVVGRLEGYDGFTLEVKKTTHSVASMTERSQHSKKTWKEVVAIVVVIIILVVIGVIIWLARKKMKKSKGIGSHKIDQEEEVPEKRIYSGPKRPSGFDSKYEDLLSSIDESIKIAISRLDFKEEIGRGHFGIVNRAIYAAPDGSIREVACKVLKQSTGIGDFIAEGLTMARFKDDNLMHLVGIAITEENSPVIVTDYMENGDLLSYLRDGSQEITLRRILEFAHQIAKGMDYLHRNNCIHRDLAARNCMLDAELNIKIGDFGLCRRVSDEYQVYLPTTHRELPFAWMAPEAIDSEKFTFKNDVWAYGIVMWELITRGLNPYGNMTGNQVLRFLQSGQRLQAPPYTPEQLYNQIILPCWDEDPERRPSFSQLLQELDNLVVSLQRNNLQQLSSRYEKLSPRNVPSIRSQDIFNRYC